MTDAGISPRARAILDAVEREVAARRARPPAPPPEQLPRPLRIDATLTAALELAVAGHSRDEVRAAMSISEDALDAVFGDGSPPQARLSRRRDQ
jgi:hypothetical protein